MWGARPPSIFMPAHADDPAAHLLLAAAVPSRSPSFPPSTTLHSLRGPRNAQPPAFHKTKNLFGPPDYVLAFVDRPPLRGLFAAVLLREMHRLRRLRLATEATGPVCDAEEDASDELTALVFLQQREARRPIAL